MWVAKKLTQNNATALSAEQGTVTIGGETAGVLTGSETRGIPVVLPGGFAWRPKSGSEVLVLKGADGEAYLLGTLETARDDMEDGDVCIFSDGASICLRADGRIDISGEVSVNGEPI